MSSASLETEKSGEWSSLAVLLAGNFITILDLFIVNVALPDIQRDLHASNAHLQLVMVAYSVAYGAILLNGARLGDFYGRRRLFLIGMAIFGLGSLLCALALSPCALIAARAIQGGGAALLMPQVYTSLRILFDDDERRRAFAVMGAVQGVAGASSQVIGGCLITLNLGDLGWRLVFLVNLPIVFYALIAGKYLIMETRGTAPPKLDIGGAVLATAALVLMLLPVMVGREQHWPWWAIIAPLLSLPLFVVFVSYETLLVRQGGTPIIDPALFKNTRFTLGVLVTFLFFSAISSFSLSLTILLQIGLGQTALEAATLFLPSTIAFFAGSVVSAPLKKKMGEQALFLGMCAFAGGLLISVFDGFSGGQNLRALTVSVILQGFGQGIVIPLLLNMVLSTVANAEAGMASGVFSTMQIVGSAFGVAVVGIILFSAIDHSDGKSISALEITGSYGNGFATATIYNLVAVVLAVFLFARLRRT
ncbi:MFS transporter [Methylovirgula sp. 4M-Z18]|uniref:MFS transporter n=1 Tax=Methylovirgula sp. 4M-Z18 TaxID=2293567 RepID=UPI000E2FD0EA|nr:MFS transporter [Methylovirgula sp. 4M-Z18]RFB81183.1 MFS transporter [Methylovirgula sp. 4M-Z18]